VPAFDEVYDAKYLLLTTFTKDGTPKPTAIWGAPDGERLLVITGDGSWKVKRIRNTARSPSRDAVCSARSAENR
jgi:PPOX class probable F420-dependent enzyme